MVEAAILHPLQRGFAGHDREAFDGYPDDTAGETEAQVGTLHAAFALGEKADGGVAKVHGLHSFSAVAGSHLVEFGDHRAAAAAVFVDILQDGLEGKLLIGNIIHVVEQAQVVPDAEVVGGVAVMESAEAALPLQAVFRQQAHLVLHHGDQHVVDRRRHVLRLALVAEGAHLFHGGAL